MERGCKKPRRGIEGEKKKRAYPFSPLKRKKEEAFFIGIKRHFGGEGGKKKK